MTDSSDCKILVTGGAGYIGSHVCAVLAQAGYIPVCYDDLSRGHEEAVQWGPLIRGDINDRDLLRRTIDIHKPQAVVHLAALTSVIESISEQKKYHHVNVQGTRAVLEVMRACGLKRIIFASSAAVYDPEGKDPIAETSRLGPQSPYGQNKLDAEKHIGHYAEVEGFCGISFRFFNAIGAAPDGSTGNRKPVPDNLIPIILSVAKGEKDRLEIFGADFPTADGTAIRDFVHVWDIALAHVAAVRRLLAEQQCEGHHIFNLGTGSGHSVLQAYHAACRVTGQNIPYEIAPRRDKEIVAAIASVGKVWRELGWKARHLDLDAMIETAWDWERKR